MVFEVAKPNHPGSEAMKIARHKLFVKKLPAEAAQTLSPVSKEECMALEQLSHPNVVRLYNTLSDGPTVFAICTTFIADPSNLDYYLRTTLEKTPKRRNVPAYSPERLETACGFLLEKCQEIASALEHMHSLSIYHFDIKPANILIPGKGEKKAMLTDMGSCIHSGQSVPDNTLRVHFTWTYAHPDLRDLLHDLTGISGGGLKVSAEIRNVGLAKYDLYAFGKTIQESLGILDEEFGERCYSSYTFRFLHLIACLLLDGNNAPTTRPNPRQRVSLQDGRRFVNDTALHYPLAVYSEHKITTSKELIERLQRFNRQYSWNFAGAETRCMAARQYQHRDNPTRSVPQNALLPFVHIRQFGD